MATINLDTSSRLDIIARRSDTFDLTIDFNTSLADYAHEDWKLQVRDADTNDSTTAGDITINVAGTAGVLPGTSGFIVSGEELRIIITSSEMNIASGVYVYDLQTTDASTGVKTWLNGYFKVVEDITI